MNHGNLMRANYPADSTGKVCMLDTESDNIKYPFIYFNSISNPLSSRYISYYLEFAFNNVLNKDYLLIALEIVQ